jgi:hypothetical protein
MLVYFLDLFVQQDNLVLTDELNDVYFFEFCWRDLMTVRRELVATECQVPKHVVVQEIPVSYVTHGDSTWNDFRGRAGNRKIRSPIFCFSRNPNPPSCTLSNAAYAKHLSALTINHAKATSSSSAVDSEARLWGRSQHRRIVAHFIRPRCFVSDPSWSVHQLPRLTT